MMSIFSQRKPKTFKNQLTKQEIQNIEEAFQNSRYIRLAPHVHEVKFVEYSNDCYAGNWGYYTLIAWKNYNVWKVTVASWVDADN